MTRSPRHTRTLHGFGPTRHVLVTLECEICGAHHVLPFTVPPRPDCREIRQPAHVCTGCRHELPRVLAWRLLEDGEEPGPIVG